jgi:hypothetical protein
MESQISRYSINDSFLNNSQIIKILDERYILKSEYDKTENKIIDGLLKELNKSYNYIIIDGLLNELKERRKMKEHKECLKNDNNFLIICIILFFSILIYWLLKK